MKTTTLLILCLLLAACTTATEQISNTAPTNTPSETPSKVTEVVTTPTPTTEPTSTATPSEISATATVTSTPEEEDPFLDFSAIEGQWSGSGEEAGGISFWIEVNLSSSAEFLNPVGMVTYGLTEDIPDCSGTWAALSAQKPSYRVRETITDGDCSNGIVQLKLDDENGNLLYDFIPSPSNPYAEAEGILMRID
jgi:hypothetical protein